MDDTTARRLARRLWTRVEPYHAVTYFAPECLDAYVEAGVRGFWRGYFAGRAAPFGRVGAGPIVGAFHGFRPDFVARALPSIWELISPAAAVDARLVGADRALRRLLEVEASGPELRAVTGLLREALDGCDPAGRPVFAANAELAWPEDAHLTVWHGVTLLREHRGDGHVAALTAAELDGAEAHVLRLAASELPPTSMAAVRGWDDADWHAARARLVDRGWLTPDGTVTPDGSAAHAEVESMTDRLAGRPVRALGADDTVRLIELCEPWAEAIVRAGDVPYPNPMGVPPPR